MTLQTRTKALAQSIEQKRSVRVATERVARIVNVPKPVAGPSAEELAAEKAACNRRSRRRQTTLPALMSFPNMRVTVPCIVSDMSGTGARLELPPASAKQFGDAEHLPGRLTLALKADRMQVECEVKWRRSGKIGVRFLGPPRPMDTAKR
jgi:hypothetical protein